VSKKSKVIAVGHKYISQEGEKEKKNTKQLRNVSNL